MKTVKGILIGIYALAQFLVLGYSTIAAVGFFGGGWLWPKPDVGDNFLIVLLLYFILVNQLLFLSKPEAAEASQK